MRLINRKHDVALKVQVAFSNVVDGVGQGNHGQRHLGLVPLAGKVAEVDEC